MKRIASVICVILLFLSGCGMYEQDSQPSPEETPLQLRWLINSEISEAQQAYFNKTLQDKGYPYEVIFEFVTPDQYQTVKTQYAAEKTPVDIMFYGPATVAESLSSNIDCYSGLALPLDAYLDTKVGEKLRSQYTDRVWEYSKIRGKTYGIPSPTTPPSQFTILWNKELAAKYGIEAEKWDSHIYHYEDDILKVCLGEKENARFVPIGNAYLLDIVFPSYTQIFHAMPFYISETSSDYTVLSKEEIPEYQAMQQFLNALDQAGFATDRYQSVQNAEYFILIYSLSNSDEQLRKTLGDDYKEKYGVLRLGELLFRRDNLGFYNSIASWSQHPNEAFDLLAAVSTDPDLSNILSWGVQGQDYDVVDGVVKERTSPPYPNIVGGNYWITYPGILEPHNKEAVFHRLFTEAKPAKLVGFWHDLSEVDGASPEEVQAALQGEIDLWVQSIESKER